MGTTEAQRYVKQPPVLSMMNSPSAKTPFTGDDAHIKIYNTYINMQCGRRVQTQRDRGVDKEKEYVENSQGRPI